MASQTDSREGAAGETDGEGPVAEDLGPAIVAEWKLWLLAVVAIVLAAYIPRTEIPGEPFYVLLALSALVVIVLRGLYNVRRRTRLFEL